MVENSFLKYKRLRKVGNYIEYSLCVKSSHNKVVWLVFVEQSNLLLFVEREIFQTVLPKSIGQRKQFKMPSPHCKSIVQVQTWEQAISFFLPLSFLWKKWIVKIRLCCTVLKDLDDLKYKLLPIIVRVWINVFL